MLAAAGSILRYGQPAMQSVVCEKVQLARCYLNEHRRVAKSPSVWEPCQLRSHKALSSIKPRLWGRQPGLPG